MRYLLTILLTAFLLQGCYTTPVNHLAANASLIQPGVSTINDVQNLLGEPKGHRAIAPGIVEYVYHEEKSSTLRKTPLVGSWLGSKGYEMIIVTLKNSIVTNCEFRTYSETDHAWADDFTWEDTK